MALPVAGQNPPAAEYAAGMYAPQIAHAELERQAWVAGLMTQAVMPSAHSLVRFARAMPRGNTNFKGDKGVPITILPGMGAEEGTKITYAIRGVLINTPNFDVKARRETMGNPVQFGKGQMEVFYIDDQGMNVGTGITQHDGLSVRDAAYAALQEWHTSLMDEMLRIPLAGRRGVGGGWFAFPETEGPENTDANLTADQRLQMVQPEAVQNMFRGLNVLKAPKEGSGLWVGGGSDDSAIAASDFLQALDISQAEAAINTVTAARHEFPFPKIDTIPAGIVKPLGGSGSPIDYIMFASGEAVQQMKTEDNDHSFSFLGFHRELASSGMAASAVFWSNLTFNIGGIGIVKEPRKWPVFNVGALKVQRSVIVGADCVRFAFGTAPWEDLSPKLGRGGMVSMGEDLVHLGQMWKTFNFNDNGGLQQNYFCAGYMGAKQNWLQHPATGEEQHHGWFHLTHSVKSVRADLEF